jgi:hypothetical protein
MATGDASPRYFICQEPDVWPGGDAPIGASGAFAKNAA